MGFVDVHSHVVPALDDGAQSLDEGLELCAAAVAAGTTTLFATPHMHAPFDQYPWSDAREELYETSFAALAPRAAELGLRLLRGREVYPTEVRVRRLDSLALEGTTAVLLEFPGSWLDVDDPVGLTWDACTVLAAEGLTPVLAHPERCIEIARAPEQALRFVDEGWLLCPNGASFLGGHGRRAREAAWWLLEHGAVALVASDAHRPERPPDLAPVHEALSERVGREVADAVLAGRALPWIGNAVS